MGFGFVDKDDEEDIGPKIKHSYRDKLTNIDWEDLAIDMKVQSVLTGTEGIIDSLSLQWYEVSISWDNGKTSCFEHKYLSNVIKI